MFQFEGFRRVKSEKFECLIIIIWPAKIINRVKLWSTLKCSVINGNKLRDLQKQRRADVWFYAPAAPSANSSWVLWRKHASNSPSLNPEWNNSKKNTQKRAGFSGSSSARRHLRLQLPAAPSASQISSAHWSREERRMWAAVIRDRAGLIPAWRSVQIPTAAPQERPPSPSENGSLVVRGERGGRFSSQLKEQRLSGFPNSAGELLHNVSGLKTQKVDKDFF